MSTSTVRCGLVGVVAAFGLLVGSATSGSAAITSAPARAASTVAAARPAAVTFGVRPATAGAAASASAAQPCESGRHSCATRRPDVSLAWSSTGSTAGCRFRLVLDWGDGGAAQTVALAGAAASRVWPVAHTYGSGVAARHSYRIHAAATLVSDPQERGCSIDPADVTLALLCTGPQLSGASWNARWPGGDRSIADLNARFRPRVQAFVAALTKAGLTVQPQSTRRSPQRAYLMHYSYLVAHGLLAAQDVPAYTPLAGEQGPSVCWLHRTSTGNPSTRISVAAARSLLGALGVDTSLRTAPALRSRHITGDAIDLQLRWTASSIKVQDAAGHPVKITSKPHDGTNADLIAVGATYGVHHFAPVAVDRNHWSSDGH